MADPISAGIAAAASGAAALFTYNKDAFVFERTIRQSEAHQRQIMRIEEVGLYREDIRDLFGVTVQKMDNYLIVNTLMLGFCISLLYAIDLPLTTPDWIYWMWTLSISGAMLFLLLSIWLCLHASITAQSLVVRLLTQWLRLPVPNAKEIRKFAAKFKDYEGSANNLLRLPKFASRKPPSDFMDQIGDEPSPSGPAVGKRASGIPSGDLARGIEDLSGHHLSKTHLHLFRQLARSWRGYDAYARVCMIMGTNQLLQALGHLSIAKTFLVNQNIFACLFVVITMHSLSLIHFKLNITPNRQQHNMMTVLLGVPPVSSFVAASLWFYGRPLAADILAIFAILIHLIWICFVLTLAIEDDGGMPKNFTQVGLSTDIVGDDTFQDYIDDELERIKKNNEIHHRAGSGDDHEIPSTHAVAGHSHQDSPGVTQTGEDPLLLVKRRLHKLVRQWNNVTKGTLALTHAEEIQRKAKIADRFDRLCRYLKQLPVDDAEIEEELRVLMDVKWNRVNSDVFINIDTGEIRTPESPLITYGDNPLATNMGETVSQKHQSPLEKFVEQIRRFKDTDTERVLADIDEDDDDSTGSDPTATHRSKSSTVRSSGGAVPHVSATSTDGDGANDSETASLIFGDSHHTNKILRKASTRPWASYKQGSGLLIICWLIALIMACLLPFDINLRSPQYTAAVRLAAQSGGFVGGGSEVNGDGGVGASHISIKLAGGR